MARPLSQMQMAAVKKRFQQMWMEKNDKLREKHSKQLRELLAKHNKLEAEINKLGVDLLEKKKAAMIKLGAKTENMSYRVFDLACWDITGTPLDPLVKERNTLGEAMRKIDVSSADFYATWDNIAYELVLADSIETVNKILASALGEK